MLGNRAGDVGVRLRFLSGLAPAQQAMSLWFEAIDKEKYKMYRSQVDFMAGEDTGMSTIKFSNNQSFMGIACLRNLLAHNHKDQGSVRGGWVGMTCEGAFTGGELCLPDQDVKIRFLPGDVVSFRSSVMSHFVHSNTIGPRSSLVFSHSSPAQRTQNARYLPQTSSSLKNAIEQHLASASLR